MQKHDLQRLVKEHAQKLVKSHGPLNGASACIAAAVLVAAGQKTIPPNYEASDVGNQYKTSFLRVYTDVNEETVRFRELRGHRCGALSVGHCFDVAASAVLLLLFNRVHVYSCFSVSSGNVQRYS